MLHAAEPDRRERERQRHLLAENGGGEIALRHVDEHALAQLDALEVGAVGAQRLLRVGAGFGVVEERARHLAAGRAAQVFNAGQGAHASCYTCRIGNAETGERRSILGVIPDWRRGDRL